MNLLAAGILSLAFISDSFSGYKAPALTTLRELHPAGVFVIGDFPHDNPTANCNTASGCLDKIRTMYEHLYDGVTLLGQDYKREILGSGTPVLGRINDDHEAKNDASITMKWWPQEIQAFAEFHVLPPDNGLAQGYMYQSVVVEDVLVILLDVRTHRDTRTGTGKTLLGAQQKEWLKAKLAQCPSYNWCVLVSPVPVNPGQHKLDSWSGFTIERGWLHSQVAGLRNVVVVSGDCHWGSIALPPLSFLPEMNIPQLNQGFSNTCGGGQVWTINSTKADHGFGMLTLTPATAKFEIINVDGSLRMSTIVTK